MQGTLNQKAPSIGMIICGFYQNCDILRYREKRLEKTVDK